MTIRPRVDADDAFIQELAGEAFGEYSLGARYAIVGMVARGSTLVATSGAKRLGFAVVEFLPDGTAHLVAISVVESERGRGVGRRILGAVEQLARSRRATAVVLATAESNVAALELFLRCGFAPRGRDPEHYSRGQHAVRMRKVLS